MREFYVDCDGGFMVFADSDEKCLKGIINVLKCKNEQICVLKKTYEGNTHDENWQNHLFVINRDSWADRLEEISKTGKGWFWDPPIIDEGKSLDEYENDWIKYACDPDSYEIYTLRENMQKKTRKYYKLSHVSTDFADLNPEDIVIRASDSTPKGYKVSLAQEEPASDQSGE